MVGLGYPILVLNETVLRERPNFSSFKGVHAHLKFAVLALYSRPSIVFRDEFQGNHVHHVKTFAVSVTRLAVTGYTLLFCPRTHLNDPCLDDSGSREYCSDLNNRN